MALKSLLPLCLLVSSGFANLVQIRSPSVSSNIAVRINATGGGPALVARDRARAKYLRTYGQAKANGQKLDKVTIPVTDNSVVYVASVGVGKGTYNLIVDTGSSNTWVGAGQPYQPGPNSQDTGEKVSVTYGSGSFSGEEFIDDVVIGAATINKQSIGVANQSTGFTGFDGIIGIGPTDLTSGTAGNGTIPTVTDNLASQGTIDHPLVAVSFAPTTAVNETNGKLDFGRTDENDFVGEITYVPITKSKSANLFWGVDQSISYGSSGLTILNTTSGIVDTGTTLLLLATDGFEIYKQTTNATLDPTTGLLTASDESKLESMFFHFGGAILEFTANAQIWPRSLNTLIGGNPDQIYLIVGDAGSAIGEGIDFINGFAFLERYYSIYDTGNSRVGLAHTKHTFDTSN